MVGRVTKPYDLIVVGGGIIGLMTAYKYLERHPDKRILLLEKATLGSGASSRAAALASDLADSDQLRRLATTSWSYYQRLQMKTGKIFYEELPTYYVSNYSSPQPIETSSQFPGFLTIGPCHEVYRAKKARYYNPGNLLELLTQSLSKNPAVTIREHTPVVGLSADNNHVRVQCEIDSACGYQVLLCTGPWLFPGQPLNTVRIKKIISFAIPEAPDVKCSILCFPDQGAFLLPQRDKKRWLLSLTSDTWDVEPRPNFRLDSKDWSLVHNFAERYLNIPLHEIRKAEVFCDGYTEDKLPVVLDHPTIQNVLIATGSSGRGIRLAPAIADMALEKFARKSNISSPVTP